MVSKRKKIKKIRAKINDMETKTDTQTHTHKSRVGSLKRQTKLTNL